MYQASLAPVGATSLVLEVVWQEHKYFGLQTFETTLWPNIAISTSGLSFVKESAFNDACLIGDSGYPVNIHLMTPIGMPANAGEQRFNISLKKTHVVVEQAIGIWKSRLKCVHHKGGTLCYSPLKCGKIAAATMLLHNFCRKRNLPLLDEVVVNPDDIDGPAFVPAPAGGGGRDARAIAGNAMRRQIIAQHFS
ncbi:putative nuclease HARBI1 [Portunus trituberculatus]|uniref:putative nuclease HARBI1 n=1 Tax=Portunus trituberculatus TaxID=210409 RepID=UPI001E1CF028|nr:putative nuclease HARBI1 [Portunus trituberculatus]